MISPDIEERSERELMADRSRLDWLQVHPRDLRYVPGGLRPWAARRGAASHDRRWVRRDTVREAIDAVMGEEASS